MFLDFLIAMLTIGFVVCFVFVCFGFAKALRQKKIASQKRKERNQRFATFDQHFKDGGFFVKQAPFDNDVFASIEEDIDT